MLVAFIFVLVLGLAVAQFFIMAGAFKRGGKGTDPTGGDVSPAAKGGAEAHKSLHGVRNSTDSPDSGGDGEGAGGAGGGA